jgi:hypothetical protein
VTRRWVLLGLCATWAVALWLVLHSGQALVLDQTTGLKYCISLLSQYTGIPQGGTFEEVVIFTTVVLTLGLPFLILGIVLAPIVMNWRARALAWGLRGRYAWLFARLKG